MGLRKYDIFISYRREDGAQYARIVQLLLEHEGFSVFLDYEELKDGQFGDKIENAIVEASLFILILTPKYLSRCWKSNDWVRREILIAKNNNKVIIPIVPDGYEVQFPLLLTRTITKYISSTQYSNLNFGSKLSTDMRSLIRERIYPNLVKNIETLPSMPYSSIIPVIQHKSTHPVNFVDISIPSGVVNSPFTALIIGFNDIGQEYFKYLYEFGTFIDSNKSRTPFKCYALDEKMDQISGYLGLDMPAITQDELVLVHTQIGSEESIRLITSIIDELNYIVISLDDINMAIFHTIRISKLCLKYRKSKSKIGIFVRCNEKGVQVLTEFYESLNGMLYIYPFSLDAKDINCDKQILEIAKTFLMFENYFENKSNLFSNELWYMNFGEETIKRKSRSLNISQFHSSSNVQVNKFNTISKALHSYTKLVLMNILDNDIRLKQIASSLCTRKPFTTNYHCNNIEDAELLHNMALLEHERWIASRKLMGYTCAPSTDYVKQHHKCMCNFTQLDEETLSYDCNVVDATIKMAYEEAMQNKSNQ